MTLVVGALLAMSLALASSQIIRQPTLAELAASNNGKPVTILTNVHVPRYTLEELSKAAHVVVIGKLVSPVSYMTPDQRDVHTDYQVQVSSTVKSNAAMKAASQVGQPPTMTVTLHGGTVLIGGVAVTVKDSSPTAWKENGDVLLFLMRSQDKNRANNFVLVGSAAGMFEVMQSGVKSLVDGGWVNEEFDRVPIDRVVQRVRGVGTSESTSKK